MAPASSDGDPPRGLDAVHRRHAHVHHDHVGTQPLERSDRVGAVDRLAGDLEVVGGVQDHPEAGAHQRLVVGHHDPDRHGGSSMRDLARGPRTRRPARADVSSVPAEDPDPLPHAAEPVADPRLGRGARARRRATSITRRSARVVERHACVGRAGVLERVRERLLDHAVRGQVGSRRQFPWSARTDDLGREAGGPHRLDQRAELGESWLRCGRRPLAVVGEHADQPSHLGEPRAARLLHLADRRLRRQRIAVDDGPRGAGLHHHDADRVGDDVVQLAGDPGAFPRDGLACRQLAISSQPLAAVVDAIRPRRTGSPTRNVSPTTTSIQFPCFCTAICEPRPAARATGRPTVATTRHGRCAATVYAASASAASGDVPSPPTARPTVATPTIASTTSGARRRKANGTHASPTSIHVIARFPPSWPAAEAAVITSTSAASNPSHTSGLTWRTRSHTVGRFTPWTLANSGGRVLIPKDEMTGKALAFQIGLVRRN